MLYIICLIYLGLTSLSPHCKGHITTWRFMGRGNQYIQLVKVLYCKLPTIGKQLPSFPHGVQVLNCRPQSVLPTTTTTTGFFLHISKSYVTFIHSNWHLLCWDIIGNLPKWHIQEKYISNQDDNMIRVHSMSIILLFFMSDVFFCTVWLHIMAQASKCCKTEIEIFTNIVIGKTHALSLTK